MAEDSGYTHNPCCSAHNIPMDCERYRRTHFVEVRPCCTADAELLMGADSEENLLIEIIRRADPDKWGHLAGQLIAAAMVRRIGGLSIEQLVEKIRKDGHP